jgi:cytochrome b561
MWRNTRQGWGAVAKALHWLVALLILVQFALGWIAVSWRLSPTKLELFVWHKSIGILVLALVVLRLLWRLSNPPPTSPPGMAGWERLAAWTNHLLLYALMLAMPLSGWIINSAANVPFEVFWLIPLPDLVGPSRSLADTAKLVHLLLFWLIAAVIAIHVAAALRHHFVRRDAVLSRMLPFGGPGR